MRGPNIIKDLLPSFLKFYYNDHDTGCQSRICFNESNIETIIVWDGSIWYSSTYEFNDKDKNLSLNPECEFTAEKISDFLLKCKSFMIK